MTASVFANLKGQYYWGLRERFQEGQISGLMDETTIGELATIRYKQTAAGKTQIESKDEARKRVVKSPHTINQPAMEVSFPIVACRKSPNLPAPQFSRRVILHTEPAAGSSQSCRRGAISSISRLGMALRNSIEIRDTG